MTIEQPTTSIVDGSEVETHPAYAVASVSNIRAYNEEASLFRSFSADTHSTIRLSISTAEVKDGRVRSRGRVVDVSMTHEQWARLATAGGGSTGVPVTLDYIGDTRVPGVPFTSEVMSEADRAREAMEGLIRESKETLASLEEAISSKKGIVATREALAAHESSLRRAVEGASSVIQDVAECASRAAVAARAESDAMLG